jgi:hypothetical protein
VGPFLAIYAAWPVFSLLDLFFGKRHVPTYRLAMEELKALGAERLSLRNLPEAYNGKYIFNKLRQIFNKLIKIFKWTGIALAILTVIVVGTQVWGRFNVSVVNDNIAEQVVRVNSFSVESVEIAKSREATEAELQSLNRLAEEFAYYWTSKTKMQKWSMDWDVPEYWANKKIIALQNKLATIPTIEERAEAKVKEEAEAKIKAEVEAKALAKAKAKALAEADAKAKAKAKAEAKLVAEKKKRKEAEAKVAAERKKRKEEEALAAAKIAAKKKADWIAEKAKEKANRIAEKARTDYARSALYFKKGLKRFNVEVAKYNKVAEDFKSFNVQVPAAPKSPTINVDGVKTAKEVYALTKQLRALEMQVASKRSKLEQQLRGAKKAEKKKKDKLSKIIKEYDTAYAAYLSLHKQLHSALSNASTIAKLEPYISRISSELIAKNDIKKIKTYNEGVVVYNQIYNAYQALKKDKNVWQKTIKQYNAGRL